MTKVACPHCQGKLSAEFIWRASGSLANARREETTGPPRRVVVCGCGEVFSVREIRQHPCNKKPQRGQERDASAAQAEAYHKALERAKKKA